MPWPPRGLTSVLIFVVLQSREERRSRERRAESGVLELSSHERNCIKTPSNYATLYNICNRRAVTIQTNSDTVSCPSFCGVVSCGAVRSFEHTASSSTRYDTGTRYHLLCTCRVLIKRTTVQNVASTSIYLRSAGQLALHKHLLATFFQRSSFSLLSFTLYWFFHFVNYFIFFVFQFFLCSFSTISGKFDSFVGNSFFIYILNIFLPYFFYFTPFFQVTFVFRSWTCNFVSLGVEHAF